MSFICFFSEILRWAPALSWAQDLTLIPNYPKYGLHNLHLELTKCSIQIDSFFTQLYITLQCVYPEYDNIIIKTGSTHSMFIYKSLSLQEFIEKMSAIPSVHYYYLQNVRMRKNNDLYISEVCASLGQSWMYLIHTHDILC